MSLWDKFKFDFWETYPDAKPQEEFDWWEPALIFGGIAVFVTWRVLR
jgi:hypothetical protein